MGLMSLDKTRMGLGPNINKDRPKAQDDTRMSLLPLDKTKVGLRPEMTQG